MRLSANTIFIFLLSLLTTTLVHAAPAGGGGTPKPKAPPLVPNENATWFCTHKYKMMYSHYKLRGTGWNKTEKEIRKHVEAAGMTTRWKFETVIGEDGKEGFESSFNLPLGRATALGQQTSMMLGINVQAKNATSGKKNVGVTCPQICKKC